MSRENKLFMEFEHRKARLNTSQFLFPMPFLIGVLLVLLIMGMTVLNINPRLGHQTDPMHFSGTPAELSAVWINVRLAADKIIITTNDRKVFQWTRGRNESMEKLNTYLSQRAQQTIVDAAIKGYMSLDHSVVVLSVDQKLTYQDIKPILTSLAHASFHRYAFETRLN